MEDEIFRYGGGGFCRGGDGGGVLTREMVDGCAYGVQLAKEVVRDMGRRRRFRRLDRGREMVKGEYVSGHHS